VAGLVLLVADARPVRVEPAGAPAPTAPPPVVAIAPPCPGQDVPPGPPAKEETVAVPALPWPADPVGGRGLGGCGDLGPPGVPPVGSAAYVLADLDSGTVLAARAPHARHRPASTLKMLLALVAARTLDPDEVVEGTAEELRIDGSKAGIGPGGRYTVRQLMAALLLNSGNDAAQVLARAMGGTQATLAAMSDTAARLGAHDTRPGTPSGLDGPGMAMSAYDLAVLFRDALREPLVAQTIGLRTVPFPGYGDHPGFTLSTTEQLLRRYPGALGSKSGFTDAARHTLVGVAERGGRRLVVTLMRGEQHPVAMWQQAAALLDWGFGQPPRPGIGRLVDP
jgi:D-alanyl-D-alanine carboxypeptidase (penicillin-binding protein 5/6)